MASGSAIILLAAALLLLTTGTAHAQSPGPSFPFYDNCRRNAVYSRWSLRILEPIFSVDNTTARACFIVRVNASAPCPQETFTMKGKRFASRCCNTSFAKIKLYVDATCRRQFVASPVAVPGSGSALSKVVSPIWDSRPANYTEVKYTQFGPIPQAVLDGTTFCLNLKKDGPCNVSSLLGITSPFNRQRRLLAMALYDRKVDGYECCPTFTFRV